MEETPDRTTSGETEGSTRAWDLETWARTITSVLVHLCAFYYCIDRWEAKERETQEDRREKTKPSPKWDKRRAFWVVGSLLVLLGVWCWNPSQKWAMFLVGGVAAYRLFEILVTSLGTALGEESQVRARNLVTIGIYGIQLTLIFAILYHSFAETGFVATGSHRDLTASDYLFISWSAITSLGTEAFAPVSEGARFLQVATTTAGILLLGVLLAFGINEVQKRNDGASE